MTNRSDDKPFQQFLESQLTLCTNNSDTSVNLWYSQFQKEFADNYLSYLWHCDKQISPNVERTLTLFLKSSEYDLQLVTLEFIKEKIIPRCNEHKTQLSGDAVLESKDIFLALTCIVFHDNTYPECLALALESLSFHSMTASTPWVVSKDCDIKSNIEILSR